MNEKLCEFKKYINGKCASVLGIGISNIPLIDFLLSNGAKVEARDMKNRDRLGAIYDELTAKGVSVICGEKYLCDIKADVIFKAPGIRYDEKGISEAVECGSVLTSEMELFFSLCPAKIFAITGSDGKTTTTTLVYKMLELAAKKNGSGSVYVGGNIGKPLLPEIEKMTEDDFCAVELSSFQLQTMKAQPEVAVITNVTPNHLNWHIDMNEYIEAKKNIFINQKKGKRLVLNYENEITREMAQCRPDAAFFSSKRILERDNCIYEENGWIVIRENGDTRQVIKTTDIILPGRHNVENYMAAIMAVHDYADNETISKIAKTFGGVEHRIEFVRCVDNVKYYNSSIDSSPTRTIAALNSFSQKLIVIMGGYDKHIPYEPLAKPLFEHAKKIVLTGATMDKIEEAVKSDADFEKSGLEIYKEPDFEMAVRLARELSYENDIVILSPACASFDAFPNFEVRGNTFKNIVNNF